MKHEVSDKKNDPEEGDAQDGQGGQTQPGDIDFADFAEYNSQSTDKHSLSKRLEQRSQNDSEVANQSNNFDDPFADANAQENFFDEYGDNRSMKKNKRKAKKEESFDDVFSNFKDNSKSKNNVKFEGFEAEEKKKTQDQINFEDFESHNKTSEKNAKENEDNENQDEEYSDIFGEYVDEDSDEEGQKPTKKPQKAEPQTKPKPTNLSIKSGTARIGTSREKNRTPSQRGGQVNMVFSQRKASPRKLTSAERTPKKKNVTVGRSVQVMGPSVYSKSVQRSELSFRVDKEEVTQMRDKVNRLETDADEQKKQVEAQKTRIEELTGELAQVRTEAEKGKADLKRMQEQTEKNKADMQQLQTQLERAEQEAQDKGKELEMVRKSTKGRLETTRDQIQKLKQECQALRSFLKESTRMRQTLQRIGESSLRNENLIEELNLQLEQKDIRLRSSAKSNEELGAQIQKMRQENLELMQKKEGIANISESKSVRGNLELIFNDLVKLKLEKERLVSEVAVTNTKVKEELRRIKSEIQSEAQEHKEEVRRVENENDQLRHKNRQLVNAIEDFKEDLGSGVRHVEDVDLTQLSNEVSARKRETVAGAEDGEIEDLKKENEDLKIDLEVHRNENNKLLRQMLDMQGQLAAIETKYDIEHIDAKLETFENENQELNQKNIKLMDELFGVRTELERYKSRLKNGESFQTKRLKELEKENQKLRQQVHQAYTTNDFEPQVLKRHTGVTFQERLTSNTPGALSKPGRPRLTQRAEHHSRGRNRLGHSGPARRDLVASAVVVPAAAQGLVVGESIFEPVRYFDATQRRNQKAARHLLPESARCQVSDIRNQPEQFVSDAGVFPGHGGRLVPPAPRNHTERQVPALLPQESGRFPAVFGAAGFEPAVRKGLHDGASLFRGRLGGPGQPRRNRRQPRNPPQRADQPQPQPARRPNRPSLGAAAGARLFRVHQKRIRRFAAQEVFGFPGAQADPRAADQHPPLHEFRG